jgi:hypothetical protein
MQTCPYFLGNITIRSILGIINHQERAKAHRREPRLDASHFIQEACASLGSVSMGSPGAHPL